MKQSYKLLYLLIFSFFINKSFSAGEEFGAPPPPPPPPPPFGVPAAPSYPEFLNNFFLEKILEKASNIIFEISKDKFIAGNSEEFKKILEEKKQIKDIKFKDPEYKEHENEIIVWGSDKFKKWWDGLKKRIVGLGQEPKIETKKKIKGEKGFDIDPVVIYLTALKSINSGIDKFQTIKFNPQTLEGFEDKLRLFEYIKDNYLKLEGADAEKLKEVFVKFQDYLKKENKALKIELSNLANIQSWISIQENSLTPMREKYELIMKKREQEAKDLAFKKEAAKSLQNLKDIFKDSEGIFRIETSNLYSPEKINKLKSNISKIESRMLIISDNLNSLGFKTTKDFNEWFAKQKKKIVQWDIDHPVKKIELPKEDLAKQAESLLVNFKSNITGKISEIELSKYLNLFGEIAYENLEKISQNLVDPKDKTLQVLKTIIRDLISNNLPEDVKPLIRQINMDLLVRIAILKNQKTLDINETGKLYYLINLWKFIFDKIKNLKDVGPIQVKPEELVPEKPVQSIPNLPGEIGKPAWHDLAKLELELFSINISRKK